MTKGATSPKRHILFADDDVGICGVFRKYFTLQGYLATTVFTGQEACRVLDEYLFDVIVIDYILPDMHGLKLLELVRQAHPRLPSIMYTGLGFDDRVMQQALEKGALAFVTKGLPMSQLLIEVRRILDRPMKSLNSPGPTA